MSTLQLVRLFKKIEKFFNREEHNQSEEKRAKLLLSLSKKIESMKKKIKNLEDNVIKSSKKEELEVLQKLKKKLEKC